ncbi:MAG: TonB-dependent receptor [Deltaproteobacteria bacterium]|nr:TonB-dependent receptor [Deltaproteobacteria bacterium]
MKGFKLIVILAGVLILIVPMFSFAEEAKESEETEGYSVIKLEEIVVTATKTEEEVARVPQAISVMTTEDLLKTGEPTIGQSLKHVTGIHVNPAEDEACGNINFEIRGFKDAYNYVIQMVDGIPLKDLNYQDFITTKNVPIRATKQVEILRGPSSALYGGNAVIGAINIRTKKGTETPESYVGLGVARYDRQYYQTGTLGRVGKLSYNLAYDGTEGDSYVKEVTSDNHRFFLRFDYDFTDDTTIEWFNIISDFERTGGREWITEQQEKEDRRQPGSYVLNQDGNQYVSGLIFKHRFNDYVDISNRLALTWMEDDGEMPTYGVTDRESDNDYVFDELRLNIRYPLGGMENILTIGGDTRQEDYHYEYVWGGTQSTRDYDQYAYGLYLQDRLTVLPDVNLTAGIRYDHYDLDYKKGPTVEKYDNTDNAWTPKFGINWEFIENQSVYGTVAKSFRTVNGYEIYRTGGEDLDPEYGWNYEVGYKGIFADRLSLALSGYWMEFKDAIIWQIKEDETGAPVTRYENAGRVRYRGIEFETQWIPMEGISLWGNCALDFSEYRNFETASGDFSDNKPNGVWRDKVNFGIDYSTRFGLDLGLSGLWRDDYYIDPANQFKADDYWCFDGRLGYTHNGFSLNFYVFNIFDEEYADSYWYSSWTDEINLAVGPERTYKLALTYTF